MCGESGFSTQHRKKIKYTCPWTTFSNAYDSMQNEREPQARELALYTSAKKRKKNDSLEGGVRKRAEMEGKECWKKKNKRMWGTTNASNKKFSKMGGHGWGVKICDSGWRSQKKKRSKFFIFFAKITQFWKLFRLNFGLKHLFWAAQNVLKIRIKRTGEH